MKYLAHIEGEREQTIKEHSIGTAELAAMFAKAFVKDDWGYCVGMLHDIGKYSEQFQKKIQGDNNIKVDHSTAGAKVCYEMGGLYGILSYCIAGHHAGLPNTGTISGLDKSSLFGRLKKGVDDFSRYKHSMFKNISFQSPEDGNSGFFTKCFYSDDVFLSGRCGFFRHRIFHGEWSNKSRCGRSVK